jgi:Trk K+ transport system NAD-binding subunit
MYAMVITCLLSTYAIKFSAPLFSGYARLFGLDRDQGAQATEGGSGEHRDIVILGFYHIGRELVQQLTETNPELLNRVAVIDFNTEALKPLKNTPIKGVFGDLPRMETLSHAELKHASIIISTLPNIVLKGVNNLGITKMCRALAPQAAIIAMADTAAEREELLANGATEALNIYADLAQALVRGLHTDSAVQKGTA